MKKEIWKDIKGYEKYYEVSTLGNVRRKGKLKNLKPAPNNKGYLSVGLSVNGIQKTKYIHNLVAVNFLNHRPEGMSKVIDHIDGNKENNKLDNLQILSNRENISKYITKNRKRYSSKYLGVTRQGNKWKSSISVSMNGKRKQIHLGLYENEEDAHIAYLKYLKDNNL